jgi:hypothetical protein
MGRPSLGARSLGRFSTNLATTDVLARDILAIEETNYMTPIRPTIEAPVTGLLTKELAAKAASAPARILVDHDGNMLVDHNGNLIGYARAGSSH